MSNEQAKLVFVDNDKVNLKVISRTLNYNQLGNSYNILTYTNPIEALEYCTKQDDIDIILLDINMPEMNGIEFIKRYNEKYSGHDVKATIIVISGIECSETISTCLNMGVADFIVRPFDSLVINSRIANALQNRKLLKESIENHHVSQILLRTILHDIANCIQKGYTKTLKIDQEDHKNDLMNVFDDLEDLSTSVKLFEAHSSGKTPMSFKEINIKDVVEKVHHNYKSNLSNKNISFCTTKVANLKTMSDESILNTQVFGNIISNAIKFSPTGGQITITTNPMPEINKIEISISDSGIGISKDLLQKIFRWDIQTSRTGTAGERGTGFGMPIVKYYVEKLGGSINVKSPYINERGTEVLIQLPSA